MHKDENARCFRLCCKLLSDTKSHLYCIATRHSTTGVATSWGARRADRERNHTGTATPRSGMPPGDTWRSCSARRSPAESVEHSRTATPAAWITPARPSAASAHASTRSLAVGRRSLPAHLPSPPPPPPTPSVPPWHEGLQPGDLNVYAIGSKLYANGERLHIKGVNWFGSEGRSGPPLGLDKHNIAWYMKFLRDNGFNAIRFLFNHENMRTRRSSRPTRQNMARPVLAPPHTLLRQRSRHLHTHLRHHRCPARRHRPDVQRAAAPSPSPPPAMDAGEISPRRRLT